MKPKHQRLVFVAVSVGFLCVAALLALRAFRDNVVYFYSPSELTGRAVAATQIIRIGGLVEPGSVKRGAHDVQFRVTDGKIGLLVEYSGILPGLFREGQGVVAEGRLIGGRFMADRVLTKHDEYYMPKEVVESLKQSGRWKGTP